MMRCLKPLSLAMMAGIPVGVIAAEPVQFDMQALESRGVDKKVASAFSETPRFLAGTSLITLTLNGHYRGRIPALFDEEGELCVTEDFIRLAGLTAQEALTGDNSCVTPAALWPQVEATADPAMGRLSLVVPDQFLVADDDPATRNWSHGGSAAMVNYDAQYMTSAGRGARSEFAQFNTESGFNAADWIVRSRQQFTQVNGVRRMNSQSIWVQRTWEAARKVMQAGQINMSNVGQVLGIQFTPENALQLKEGGPALVQGIAETQSVVEVRQAGVLLYNTTVPAGPYSLRGFRLLNTRMDLQVKMIGSDGSVREFVVPASTFPVGGESTRGLSFGIGRPDQAGVGVKPLLGTMSGGVQLGDRSSLDAEMLASSAYTMAGITLSTQAFRPWMLTLQNSFSRDARHNEKGIQTSLDVSWSPVKRLTLGGSLRMQSPGYRELYDALQSSPRETAGMNRRQAGLSLGWDAYRLGSLMLSAGRTSSYGGRSSDYVSGMWSKNFGSVQLSASLSRSARHDGSGAENLFYLTMSLPLGTGRLNSYISEGAGQARTGLRWSDRFSQDRGYSLAAERDLRSGRNSGTATGDMVTKFSQLSGSVSGGDNRSTSLTARASGAVVAHRNGVTASPYQVGDTFGIARVGQESGVRIDTPAGPAWTDARGFAILPGLSGYRKSVVQVDTRSLDKNVDISNAWLEAEVAHGAVPRVDFDVVRARRILATIRNGGEPIPHGASIFDNAGTFITVAGDKGSVFIPDAQQASHYDVQVSGQTLCSFRLTLPERPTQGVLYETADSVCS